MKNKEFEKLVIIACMLIMTLAIVIGIIFSENKVNKEETWNKLKLENMSELLAE